MYGQTDTPQCSNMQRVTNMSNMISETPTILCWNVRGLNMAARCLTVHETLVATRCHIACLQETKLHNIDKPMALFLGGYRLQNFANKPTNCTRGGILILWDDNVVQAHDVHIGRYFVTTTVTMPHTGVQFKLTAAYGPSRCPEKESFLQHLRDLKT